MLLPWLIEGIQDIGIISSLAVRPCKEDSAKYEILSGHNRFEAAKFANLSVVPVRIFNDLSDDEAAEIFTETNLCQRSFKDFPHSERAAIITARHNALKKQGRRTDLTEEVDKIIKNDTSAEVPQKSSARETVAKEYGVGRDTIACYLRINELIPELQARLDKDEFKLEPAVEISYITKEQQSNLHVLLENNKKCKLNTDIAKKLREASKSGSLSQDGIEKILKNKKEDSNANSLKSEIAKHFKPETDEKTKTKLAKYVTLIETDIPKIISDYSKIEKPDQRDMEKLINNLIRKFGFNKR